MVVVVVVVVLMGVVVDVRVMLCFRGIETGGVGRWWWCCSGVEDGGI